MWVPSMAEPKVVTTVEMKVASMVVLMVEPMAVKRAVMRVVTMVG